MTFNLDIFYNILAIGNFNSERRKLFHILLKKYLKTPSDNFERPSRNSRYHSFPPEVLGDDTCHNP